MSVPSWQQGQAEEEQEYQATMKRLGEAEQTRMASNFLLDEDYLSLDDGRPGFSWGTFGPTFGLGPHVAYYLLGIFVAIFIIVVGQILKHTSYGQQALQPPPPPVVQQGGKGS
jgi:hypothetical protein